MSNVMSRRVSFALGACVAGLMSVAACGDSGPSISDSDTAVTASPSLPPIKAAGVPPSVSARSSATPESADASVAADDAMLRIAWIHYTITGELPALPGVATAWRIDAGAVDPARMETIARAFGITDALVEVPATEGGGWRAGPTDGTAPSITFPSSPTLDWYYSPAWAAGPEAPACVEVMSDPEAPADAVSIEPLPVDGEGGGDSAVHCPPPTPPENVPTAEQALARAGELLEAAGFDLAAFELQVDGDEWGRYVTAFPLLDGLRSPLATSLGFGGDGAVTWAGGSLATPTAVGEYPLISVADGVERLNAQEMWWRGDVLAVDGDATAAAESGAAVEPAAEPAVEAVPPETAPSDSGTADTPVTDAPDTVAPDTVAGDTTPADPADVDVDRPVEPIDPGDAEPIEVSITGVRQDLTVVWDVDNTVWLLPAYTYTNADGIVATVAAVTEDYLVYPEAPVDDTVVDPQPVPGESTPASGAAEAPDVIGLTEEEAARLAAGSGWTLRVVSIDGEDLAVTADLRSDRINVALEGGVVVSVTVG